ncbi:retrovirus-related pol polyprotein from transposon TNT 1-94 [Tanacetum coccineum]
MHTTSSWKRRSSKLIRKSFVKFFRYFPEFSTKTLLHHPQKKNWLHSFRNLAILAGAFLGKQQDLIDSGNHELKSCGDKTISMRNKINLHTIRDESLLGTLKFVSKTQHYQQYGALIPDDMINQDIKDFIDYKTYYDFATGKVLPRKARKYKKVASPLRKLSPVKEAEPVKKAKRVKRPAKMSTTVPTTCVVIRDTPSVSEAAQLKEATKRSKKDFHISQASGSGDGTDFESRVPDEQQRKTSGTDEGTSDDDKADHDDDGNEAYDSERTDSNDDDENPSFTLKDYDEEEHDEEYESDDDNENVFEEEDDDMYKDVDVRSLGAEHEKERQGDEEMTDANQNVSQEQPYEQVVEDAHVTLTASQKTDDSKQSSSVSSDFANQFLILEKAPPSDHEVASLMNIKMSHEVPSTQISSPLTEPATVILDSSTITSTTILLTVSMISPLPQLTTPTPAPTTALTTTLILILPKEVSDFATPVIQSTVNESLKNVIVAKSSSQPKFIYEAAESLTEFEFKKILVRNYFKVDFIQVIYGLKRIIRSKTLDQTSVIKPSRVTLNKKNSQEQHSIPLLDLEKCLNLLDMMYTQHFLSEDKHHTYEDASAQWVGLRLLELSVRHNVNLVRSTKVNTCNQDNQYLLTVTQTVLVLEIGALLLRPHQDHPLKNMEDRGIFESGCSGHKTGNKDHLDDFKNTKGDLLPLEKVLSVKNLRHWMIGNFKMSSMGELIFFLGLQVKQKIDGIFISQDKYVADMLKKFNLASMKTAITPMETKMALTKDEEADVIG